MNLEDYSLNIIMLFCYVDNELDAGQRAAVEEILSHNLAARMKIAEIKELNMLLKAAYSHDGEGVLLPVGCKFQETVSFSSVLSAKYLRWSVSGTGERAISSVFPIMRAYAGA